MTEFTTITLFDNMEINITKIDWVDCLRNTALGESYVIRFCSGNEFTIYNKKQFFPLGDKKCHSRKCHGMNLSSFGKKLFQ
ncbi:hypothetical protein [Nostoc sp.]|uniref:hypothetical protein n=1 Tax=Nostoc sp. TaxID=1180 RepID=UPI002FF64C77